MFMFGTEVKDCQPCSLVHYKVWRDTFFTQYLFGVGYRRSIFRRHVAELVCAQWRNVEKCTACSEVMHKSSNQFRCSQIKGDNVQREINTIVIYFKLNCHYVKMHKCASTNRYAMHTQNIEKNKSPLFELVLRIKLESLLERRKWNSRFSTTTLVEC